MSSFLNRKFPIGRPRRGKRKDNLADITKVTVRLLARKDFDAWSMAELARESGCSVGALYARLPDKHACLHYAIGVQFGSMIADANSALFPPLPDHPSAAEKGELFVNHVVTEMTAPSASGIIRATMKLSTLRPKTIEKFEEYRKAVSDHVVALLRDDLPKDVSTDTVRLGVQIVLATVTDSILQTKPGPMTAGSRRMKLALTNIFLGYLGIAGNKKWARQEADEDEGRADNEIFEEPPDAESLYDPKEQGFRRSKGRRTSTTPKAKSSQEEKPLRTRKPPDIPKPALPRRPMRSRRKSRIL